MSEDEEYFFCYLAAWVVDRVVTTMMSHSLGHTVELCSYEEIKDQASVIYMSLRCPWETQKREGEA